MDLGDVNISFGQLGVNKITHPVSFKNGKSSYSVDSDWISPYQAGAIVNGLKSGNHAAVSGNHGTSGGGGFATANTKSTVIKADEQLVANNFNGTARKIEITIVNEVTLRENIDLLTGERTSIDFEETIIYTVERNHMKVSNLSIKAFTPMYIEWYMGLQFTNQYNNSIYFTVDPEKTLVYPNENARRDSGKKVNSPDMTRATLANNVEDLLHVYIDKDYGIGYDYINDNQTIAYSRENNAKFYFHLVKSGNTLEFDAGDVKSYRGGYIFSKNTGTNAYVSKFVEDGIKKAFIDFRKISTEQIKYTSIEESVNVTGNGTSLTSTTSNAFAKVVI